MDIIIMALTAILLACIYYIMFYIPNRIKRDVGRKIGDLAHQQRLMDKLRDNTNIERVLILKSHNGTGVPRPGYTIKVTALYESYEPPFKNVVLDYQNLTVDGDYILMLEEVKHTGYTAFFTHQMKDSLLRRIYEQEGVMWSYVFFIGQDSQNWYYGSLATSDHQSPFQKEQGIKVELFVNNIRELYRRLNNTRWKRIKDVFNPDFN